MKVNRLRKKNAKSDEVSLNAYKTLINEGLVIISKIKFMLNDITDNKFTIEQSYDILRYEETLSRIMADLTENKFTPSSVEMLIRKLTPVFIENIEETMSGFMTVHNMTKSEIEVLGDYENIMDIINKNSKKIFIVMDYLKSTSITQCILSRMGSLLDYEIIKIKNDFDFISNYYDNLNVFNVKMRPVIEYTIRFTANDNKANNNKEEVKNGK